MISYDRRHGFVQATVLPPSGGEAQSDTDLVIVAPHQQGAKPATIARAAHTRDIVAPDSNVVLISHNSGKQVNYMFDGEDLDLLRRGHHMPQAELFATALENYASARDKRLALTGYSAGALAVFGIAARDPQFEIVAVNGDEMPSAAGRTYPELRKDFLQRGGDKAQLAAIADASIPVIQNEVYTPARLYLDYFRFFMDSLDVEHRALARTMAGSQLDLLQRAVALNPDVPMKRGRVEGSPIDQDPDLVPILPDGATNRLRQVVYTGPATHGHATGDNIVAHALMVQDGIGRLAT